MHLSAPGCYVRHDWDSILPILHDEIEQYDKYLIQLAIQMAADRDTSYPSMALRDFYRRMAGDIVEVWRPWLPENEAEYWRNLKVSKRANYCRTPGLNWFNFRTWFMDITIHMCCFFPLSYYCPIFWVTNRVKSNTNSNPS